jgi:cyclic beta-1,2-glucan synthetase
MATALQGDGDRAFELYQMLNPFTHTKTGQGVATYKVEPYVIAADVYTAAGHLGRGGWTWYTGSSSWMYRVGLETILGFKKTGTKLRIDPCVPRGWPSAEITYSYGASRYRIEIKNADGVSRGVRRVTLDGKKLSDGVVPLADDGAEHVVVVEMGAAI